MPNKLEIKSFDFEIKSFDEEKGTFEGYASVFGNKDSYKDIVQKGAFLESLQKRSPVMLWQHNTEEVIGIFPEVREDSNGLFVKGELILEVQKAKEARALLKRGALKGLSIGFSVPKGGREFDEEKDIKILKKVDLFEISIVTFPANEKTLVNNIKSNIKEIEQFNCMKDFENFLKEPRSLNTQERKTFISKLKEFSNMRDVEEQTAKKRDAEAKTDEFVLDSLKNVINQIKDKNE